VILRSDIKSVRASLHGGVNRVTSAVPADHAYLVSCFFVRAQHLPASSYDNATHCAVAPTASDTYIKLLRREFARSNRLFYCLTVYLPP
jgi:hypothetical protein